MKATVTSKGQVTIPSALRNQLGIGAGTVLQFQNEGGSIRVKKVIDEKRMRSVFGCCREAMKGMSWEKWAEQTRGRKTLVANARRRR